MTDPRQLKFSKSLKNNMDQLNANVFDGVHKSYIADGDNIFYANAEQAQERERLMAGARANLVREMLRANTRSAEEAASMRQKHIELRGEMREAIRRAKEASRKSDRLRFKALSEHGKESEGSREEMRGLLQRWYDRKLTSGNDNLTEDEAITKVRDLQELFSIKSEDMNVERSVLGSMLESVHLKRTRSVVLDEEASEQKNIETAELQRVREKARRWNDERKSQHQDTTFRSWYNLFDNAAARYHILNRSGIGASMPAKEIKEYVGEFDLDALDSRLSELEVNPYLTVDMDSVVVDKNNKRLDASLEHVKTHHKITLHSVADENGLKTRYKLTGDANGHFVGYRAARQYDPNNPNALMDRVDVVKDMQDSSAFNLKVDEKDARNNYINSDRNLEIQQLDVGRFFSRKVGGVVINGLFIPCEDNAAIRQATDRMKQKEKVRSAVLKAKIFNEINSRTIQHAIGYGAGGSADDVIKDMKEELAKEIQGDGLQGWNDQKKADLDEQKQAVEAALFSDTYENQLLAHEGHELPDQTVAAWQSILLGNDEEAREKLPKAAKAKAVFDVIRLEYKLDNAQKQQVLNPQTRIGRIIEVVKDQHEVLSNVALMLLSKDNQPDYWDMAKTICSKLLLTGFEKKVEGVFASRYNRALNRAGAQSGQLMRMALIDELKADRSHIDFTDFFNKLTPTRWKQFREDLQGRRGMGAIALNNLTDGSAVSGLSQTFGAAVDMAAGFKLAGEETLDIMKMAKQYTDALRFVVDLGALTEIGSYAIGDTLREGKDNRNDLRGTIAFVASIIKNSVKLIRVIVNFYKDRKKEIEKKAKDDPDYSPQEELKFLKNKTYIAISELSLVLAAVGKSAFKQFGNESMSGIFGMIRNGVDFVTNFIDYLNADGKLAAIDTANLSLDNLLTRDEAQKTEGDRQLIQLLKDNSQLQWGLALAARNNRAKKVEKVQGMVKNSGKVVLGALKQFVPGTDKNPIFIVADSIWDIAMTGISTIEQIVQHKKDTKDSIKRMLGEAYADTDRSILDEVLRRETGIVSTDYLTDLSRVFMSINTHVFMNNAVTDKEKALGTVIARNLFNNSNYVFDDDNPTGHLEEVKAKDIMEAFGVKDNYHIILKHSLA